MTSRSLCRCLAWIPALAIAWHSTGSLAQNDEAERELGRQFAFEAGAQIPLVRDREVVNPVRRIGGHIVDGLGPQPFEYRFFIVRDEKVNAFAVPGGYVYVHAGLLAEVENDDQLAGVLAHEIAHVHAHHLSRQQEATQWLSYAQLFGLLTSFVQPALGAAAMGASATAQLQYKREFEQEADYLGARYMKQAGFAPQGMLDFFQKLWERQRMSSNAVPPYLLTHPLTGERLSRLEAVLRTSQWNAGPRPGPSADLQRARLLAQLRSDSASPLVAACQGEVAARPGDAQARYELGYVLLEVGSYEAARETLEQARALGYAGAERELGRVLLRLRQAAKARPLLAQAAETDPADAVAQFEYGRALEDLGETEGAVAAYRRAVAADPDLEDAQRQLGLQLGRAGEVGEGYYHLGKAYLLRGEYPQALVQFEKAAAALPSGAAQAEVKSLLPQLRQHLDHR